MALLQPEYKQGLWESCQLSGVSQMLTAFPYIHRGQHNQARLLCDDLLQPVDFCFKTADWGLGFDIVLKSLWQEPVFQPRMKNLIWKKLWGRHHKRALR